MASGVARNAAGIRWDHLFIVDVVPEGARVLDLGCGKGVLLRMLIDAKKVRGTGIEIVEDKAYEAVAKGVTVYNGDFDEGLSYYPDNSFDYVILSQTLQEARETVPVLTEALRVGRYVVASFPNFGHWKSRLQLLFTGKSPVTGSLPYQWYNTPNIHFLTIRDFRDFTREYGIGIARHFYVGRKRPLHFWPNLFANYGVFVLEKLSPEAAATRPGGEPPAGNPVDED